MKNIELSRAFLKDHFVCSICGNFWFEVEPVSQEKVRLTCKNCGQCHLLVARIREKNHLFINFCDETKNKTNFA
jgi:transcription elongation factor Elf1